jgi:general stress protein YciG
VAIKDRGFASMDQEKRREIASKGGRAAHVKGTAHEWTPDEAREAGRKSSIRLSSARAREIPAPPPTPNDLT